MRTAQFLEKWTSCSQRPDFVTPEIANEEARDRKAENTTFENPPRLHCGTRESPWNHRPLNPLSRRRVVGS
jgi:hypothetical protein